METTNALPKVNEYVFINDDICLAILAVDLEEGIWTCIDKETNEVQMWNFDENRNSGIIRVTNIDWPDFEDENGEDEC